MESSELRRLLNEGIVAVKTDDRPRARELLLRVLDADDRSEPAWLWLSAALDEPDDKLLALERVLAINPGHPQALAGVKALRQRLGKDEPRLEPAAEQPVEVVRRDVPCGEVARPHRPPLADESERGVDLGALGHCNQSSEVTHNLLDIIALARVDGKADRGRRPRHAPGKPRSTEPAVHGERLPGIYHRGAQPG